METLIRQGSGGGSGTTALWIPAANFGLANGSPSLTAHGSATSTRTAGWRLDDSAAEERIAANWRAPSDWATYDVAVWVSPINTNTGNAWMQHVGGSYTSGGGEPAGIVGTEQAVAMPGVAYELVIHELETGVSCDPSGVERCQINRYGSNASDTFVGDVTVLGVMVSKAS